MTKRMIEWGAFSQLADGLSGSAYIANQTTFDTLQASPLDGVTLDLISNSNLNYTQRIWGPYGGSVAQFNIDDVSTFIDRISARTETGWGRIKHNFLAAQTPDLTIDWFSSDIEKVISNLILIGRVVAETGMYGILFDAEHYGTYPFTYNEMPLRNNYNLQDYYDKVYESAFRVAQGWLSYSPDIKLFLIKGYESYVTEEISAGSNANNYGFYGSFLDGIYEAFGQARSNVTPKFQSGDVARGRALENNIIDTQTAYRELSQDGIDEKMGFLTNPIYHGNTGYWDTLSTELGLAHFPSNPNDIPFDNAAPLTNYYTPTSSKNVLRIMLDAVDWVWIYSELYDACGPGTLIHPDYRAAWQELRTELGML